MTRIVRWEPGMTSLGRAVVSIGVFDGVHIGHQALIRDAVALARERRVSSAVVTFDLDPDRVVDPEHAAPQLLDLDEKLALISRLEPDVVLVVSFTGGLARTTPEGFLDTLLLRAFEPVATVVGFDFRFGAGAAGDLDTLAAYGARHGFEVVGHPLVRAGGEPVTSTRIRALIAAGDVASAAKLLGRPHSLTGTVVSGRHEGTALGAPTANLDPPSYAALPRDGVYAGRTVIDGVAFAAAVSAGAPPTFPGACSAVEVHVIGFSGDLYGRRLTVELIDRLRDLSRFDSAEALSAAIATDLAAASRLAGA